MNQHIFMDEINSIVAAMATSEINRPVQLIQTRYRMALAERWGIAPGMRILEIACGQGDMTAVLANAVGPTGHVTAVDIADPHYGSPVTLGDSIAYLKASALGERIDVHLQYDLLDPTNAFPPDSFDAVVLAHGAWYFASLDQVRQTLARVQPWAERLFFAEWDLAPESYQQIAHFLAVTIQGETEAYRGNSSDANVRTPFSLPQFITLLGEAGWELFTLSRMNTESLQDGDWEVDICLENAPRDVVSLDIPANVRTLIAAQIDALRHVAGAADRRPLTSYAISATRIADQVGESYDKRRYGNPGKDDFFFRVGRVVGR